MKFPMAIFGEFLISTDHSYILWGVRIARFSATRRGIHSRSAKLGRCDYGPDISHFILCDITNFAGIGDVIARNFDGSIDVKEIKSGKAPRGIKWKERLKRGEKKRQTSSGLPIRDK